MVCSVVWWLEQLHDWLAWRSFVPYSIQSLNAVSLSAMCGTRNENIWFVRLLLFVRLELFGIAGEDGDNGMCPGRVMIGAVFG